MADAPTRLNLGCGLNAPEGWLNIDRSPNLMLDRVRPLKHLLRRLGVLSDAHMAAWPRNIVMRDVRRPLPCDDGSIDAIYSSHMLEHLHLDEAAAVLRECRRALRPEGVLRLALPDGTVLAREFVEAGDSAEAARHFNNSLNAHPSSATTFAKRLLGSGMHRWQPTPALVTAMLVDAGFGRVERRPFREGAWDELDQLEHRPDSFFLEAQP